MKEVQLNKILGNVGGFIGGLWGSVKATFAKVFGSRKTTIGVVAMALVVVSYLAPELQGKAEQIAQMIVIISGFVVGGVTIEDSVTKWAARPQTATEALTVIKDGLNTPGVG